MLDKLDATRKPEITEIDAFVGSALWDELRVYMDRSYAAQPAIAYSRCSGAAGWNVKYRKGGRGLCTLYPEQGVFTALVVIGEKERAEAELSLPGFTEYVQAVYQGAAGMMGQRWLMIEVRDAAVLADVRQLIAIRRRPDKSCAK